MWQIHPIELHHKRLTEPSILRTCKQIRAEAAGICYTINTYHYDIKNLDFRRIVYHIRTITRHGVRRLSLPRSNHITLSPNRKLESIIELVEVIAETGVTFGGDEEKFKGLLPRYPYDDREAHVEAMAMGMRAYREGWSDVLLEDEFVQWVDEKEAGRRRGRKWY